MILVLIHVLITIVVGAIVFWIIDKYVRDRRLSNLLKLLVILIWPCRHSAAAASAHRPEL